jgi:hypothetical protein
VTTVTKDGRITVGLFAYRMIGAALLDASIYEGVEADRSAMRQAIAVVLLSSAAAGIGGAGWTGPTTRTMITIAGVALITWVAWAMLMYQIGARMMPEPQTETSPAELIRTIGFAASPGVLQVFAMLPRMRGPVFVAAWLWMFAATVMAVKHALDYRSMARTLAVCALAALLCMALAVGAGLVFGPVVS